MSRDSNTIKKVDKRNIQIKPSINNETEVQITDKRERRNKKTTRVSYSKDKTSNIESQDFKGKPNRNIINKYSDLERSNVKNIRISINEQLP